MLDIIISMTLCGLCSIQRHQADTLIMNNASANLDAALLADGVLWRAANQAYRTATENCADNSALEPAMDAARDVAVSFYGRIAGTLARTPAGIALKLEMFVSRGISGSPAEEAEGRAEHLADLIEAGDFESAIAYGLMADFIAMGATPTPSVPLARKPRAA